MLKRTAIKNPTLLHRFILDRHSKYVEPTRKGTAKGDPIGYGKTKYKATLFLLYDVYAPGVGGMKGVAKLLGVSYGLLRKWYSEGQFRATMLLNMVDFADVFFNFAEQLHERKYGEHEAFLRRPAKRIAVDSDIPDFVADDVRPIGDGLQYSPTLIRCILAKCKNEASNFDLVKSKTFSIVLREIMPDPTDEMIAKLKELGRQHDYVYMDKLLAIAIKPSISKADQKQLVFGLRLMREKFQPPKDASK